MPPFDPPASPAKIAERTATATATAIEGQPREQATVTEGQPREEASTTTAAGAGGKGLRETDVNVSRFAAGPDNG